MRYRKQAHAVYYCSYHLVLPTKYRRQWINKGIFAYLSQKLAEVTKFYPEIDIEEQNHDVDHIHLLISIPPKMSVGSVVRLIKSNTARELKRKFPFLKELYWGSDGVWSDGYFVSTIGINEETIRQYIEKQGSEDSGRAELELS